MKILLILGFYSLSSLAQSDPLYTSVTFEERLGDVFREEVASSWPRCIEHKKAEKIILHKKNELREIAIWRANGKYERAGANNRPALRAEVDAIFARSQVSGNPCVKEPEQIATPNPKPLDTPAAVPEETPVEIDYSHGTPQ
jgi:hypothetical protein